MKKRLLHSMICLFLICNSVACLQTENSSSEDAGTYTPGETEEFKAAKVVFQQYCTSCHQHSYQSFSEQDFVDQGLVVPGDSDNSELYFRLIGSSSPRGPKDMPQDGPLYQNDMAIIKTWIDNL